MVGREECISDDRHSSEKCARVQIWNRLKQIGSNIPQSHQKECFKAGCHSDDIFGEKGLQLGRTRTNEAEELVHATIPVLVTGSCSRWWRNKNQSITPNSPQGVVANEVYPYPPRFNQRTWRERCNAGYRFESVARFYQVAA